MRRDAPTTRAEGRLADRALVLTAATFLLLTLPLLGIFDRPILVLGIPLLHIYCYGVWTAAIGCGAWLATSLSTPSDGDGDTGPSERG